MNIKVKYEYLLGIIALLWVLFFAFTIQLKPEFSTLGDDGSYLFSARLLYFQHQIDNTRPILISALHGLPYFFNFNDSFVINWGLFINFITWFFTSIVIFKISSKILNRSKAFYLAILFQLCIGNLAHAFNFLSESVFIFLILLSVYFMQLFFETKKQHYISIALSIVLLNTLIKPVSIGFALIIMFFFIKKTINILFNKYSFILLFSISLLIFQMYSLKRNYGDFTLSYISSITYYNYLGDKADCYKKGLEYLPSTTERNKKFYKLSSHEMKVCATKDLINQIKNNTFNLCKAYVFCLYSNTHKGNYIVSECKNKNNTFYFNFFQFIYKAISKIQNITFTIISIVLAFYYLINYKKNKKIFLIIAFYILYIFFISGMSCFQCDRFHIAIFPLIILLITNLKRIKYNAQI